jgi:Leucine-rich repeat (LRR) protein
VVGAITQLILPRGNGIHSLAGLEKLYAIEELDLAHNVIGSLSEVARLGRLPSLTRVWFEGNPIELGRNYRAEVLGLLQDGDKVSMLRLNLA